MKREAIGCAAAPRTRSWATAALPPLLDWTASNLLHSTPQLLMALVRQHGSPLHVLWPHRLKENVQVLRTVLTRHEVRFELFYGAKVNKSPALVRAAVESGIGVDVSSAYELRDALLAGADPRRICATGPVKTDGFLARLQEGDSLIAVDSVHEFNALERLGTARRPARVLLRYRPASAYASRFGMDGDEIRHCLQRLAATDHGLVLEGFHFHLGGYAHEPRAAAVHELAAHVAKARALRLRPRVIDIGGGLPIRYVEADLYQHYLREQRPAHYRHGRVPDSFYPYGGEPEAGQWLDLFLRSPAPGGGCIADYLRREDLALAIEPGRSLVDQTAVSAFRVHSVKPLARDRHVVFVEGSSFSACETWFGSEYLVDPILVSDHAGDGEPCHAYIAGHSCLDDDVLTNRLIAFPRRPRPGDLLVYANTAGYQMDLLENEFHRHPMPRRLAARPEASQPDHFVPDLPWSD